jgi:hypothetical protein
MMIPSVASRLACGVIAPVFAMLVAMVGLGFYQHDFSLQIVLQMLVPAAILGAPLSVPVAFFLAPRNIWASLPLIAIAAGIGIQLQFRISGMLEDANADSIWQFISSVVYVVPALLGAATSLVLRWKNRIAIAAIPIAAIASAGLWIAGNGDATVLAPANDAAKEWSVLKVGMLVYTGSTNGAQAVCPTLASYFDSQRYDRPCAKITNGTPVVVEKIVPCKNTDPQWGWESPAVEIRARDGSWRGFTDSDELQPNIPIGTLLYLQRDWGAPLSITDDRDVTTNIGAAALVRLLRYDPKRDASLYVEILKGEHEGMRGWTGIQLVSTGGLPLGEYSMQYPNDGCERPGTSLF